MLETAAHFVLECAAFCVFTGEQGNPMAIIDYGDGEREFRCTAITCMIYEQEFVGDPNDRVTGDLIADTIGKVTLSSNDVLHVTDEGAYVTTVLDYTQVNWNAIFRALWAMLKTAQENGGGGTPIPGFKTWQSKLMSYEPDMKELSYAVQEELMRGLFRSGAAASGKTSEEE